MSIDFSSDRWEKVKDNYSKWWDGKLERPLVPVIIKGRDPGRTEPSVPLLDQATCADLNIPASDLIDRIDYELSTQTYLGDAFPFVNMSAFGPGVVAAFLGADLDNSTGRVWFHPKEIIPITDIHFEYDPGNVWLNRLKDLCGEAMKRWQGKVLVGMTDLGGVLDILSTFRPAEKLMLDLYDYPEEVKRLVSEIHMLWYKFYNEINEVLQPVNPGYSDWAKIYSDKPSYVIQSDFSYMISTDMFNEFVKSELEASCNKLDNTMYHLDGVGQLAHLDSLLEIKQLKAVQWVPGKGKPDQANWPEVHKKIHQAGKNLQIHGGFDVLDKVSEQIGTSKGIHVASIVTNIAKEDVVRRRLAQYGIE